MAGRLDDKSSLNGHSHVKGGAFFQILKANLDRGHGKSAMHLPFKEFLTEAGSITNALWYFVVFCKEYYAVYLI